MRKLLKKFPLLEALVRRGYYFLRNEPIIVPYDLSAEKIRKLLGKDHPTILEIGCHDGENTQWFIEQFKQPVIHCFEPDPRAIKKFRENFSQYTSVSLHEFALGDKAGTATFHQSSHSDPTGDWDASGSLMAPKNHLKEYPWVTFDSSVTVDVETLDAFCEKNDVKEVDFIWMDVQGAELKVISGGNKTFAKTRFIVTEYNNKELYSGQPHMKQILAALPNHRVLARYSDDLLLVLK
ncbi:MAG: FkbM family methyltransferase [Akkermansiaceae bacterium]|nr:FkbM family methyltransferase [Akkermansiaceae bacterium]